MNKEIRVVSDDGKIVQCTTFDERWYIKSDASGQTPYPSVTWITSFYPKGIGYAKWLANHGWDDSQSIMRDAGDRGYRVHSLITALLDKKVLDINMSLPNPTTGILERITLEEYEAVMSFCDWFNQVQPKVLGNEVVIFNDEYGYAGTLDLLCEIAGEKWLLDFKTSQDIWPSHKLQLSGYKKCVDVQRMAILQVGYRKNKNRWKFTEVTDQFDLFLATKQIWQAEAGKQQPLKKDYPVKLQLNLNVPVQVLQPNLLSK